MFMKIKDNRYLQMLIIFLIGTITPYFIIKIGSETDGVVVVEYFDRIMVIIVIVIFAMAVSSFLTRKIK